MDVSNMTIDDLNDETRAKLLACKTPEDILALAKAEGVELSDAQLEDISGGIDWISCKRVNCGPGYSYCR